MLRRDLSECDKERDGLLDASKVYERTEAAKVALIPVPIGWIMGYAIAWIKRGFISPSN
jgi:hypothetical protein